MSAELKSSVDRDRFAQHHVPLGNLKLGYLCFEVADVPRWQRLLHGVIGMFQRSALERIPVGILEADQSLDAPGPLLVARALAQPHPALLEALHDRVEGRVVTGFPPRGRDVVGRAVRKRHPMLVVIVSEGQRVVSRRHHSDHAL